MGALIRLRAYAGLWTLLAGLCAALVFLSAAAGPVSRQVADRALRQLVAEAPQSVRDITVSEPAAVDPITAARMRDEVTVLPEAALVVVPAGTAGWLLHLPVSGRPGPQVVAGVGVVPVVAAVVALLVVPAAVTRYRGGVAAGRRGG